MTDWEAFWDSISVLDVVLVIVGVSLVIGFIAKGWPKIHAGIRLIDALGDLPDRLDNIEQKIGEIHHEVNYNNGSSVKDAVTRMETEQTRQAEVQEQQGDMLAAALLSDEQLATAIDDLTTWRDDHEETLTKE